ncbi:MAG TPA: UxaA family hydrolase [Solirubrobacteraceae bacterium]|jgi:hypothetical protein|nr:UxaA family hydrolase [Solirubrobacteraceae bacterium]
MSQTPAVVSLGDADNVVVAVRHLSVGEKVTLATGLTVMIGEDIPLGHKLAIRTIDAGAGIVKYGAIIGTAITVIPVGSHVHVHNVISARLPGKRSR